LSEPARPILPNPFGALVPFAAVPVAARCCARARVVPRVGGPWPLAGCGRVALKGIFLGRLKWSLTRAGGRWCGGRTLRSGCRGLPFRGEA